MARKEPSPYEKQLEKDQRYQETLAKSKATLNFSFWKRIVRDGIDDATYPLVSEQYEATYVDSRTAGKATRCKWGLLYAHVVTKSKMADYKNSIIEDFGYNLTNKLDNAIHVMIGQPWLRDLSDWKPGTYNPYRQFMSLASHLFCQYKMPEFLFSCFFGSGTLNWFLHLAGGGSVLDLPHFPVMFTKKMAHLFMQAPSDLHIFQAIRFAQIKGLGGDRELLKKVNISPLGRQVLTPVKEDFYETLYQFYIHNPMFDRDTFQQTFDFLEFEKFGGHPNRNADFTLKGRTPESLMRLVNLWHGDIAKKRGKHEWKSCGINGYFFEDTDAFLQTVKATWEITELLNSNDLIKEGKALKHCVGSYAFSCTRGGVSIFSLTMDKKKQITIEIDVRSRMIRQVRGNCNRVASVKEKQIISAWASQNNLGMSSHL